MKKIVVIFMLIFVLPFFSAIEVEMKDSFNEGETLFAKITGRFAEPLLKEDILFYRGHVRVSVNPYVAKINEDYYIYAQLGDRQPGNYSMRVEDAKYYQATKIIQGDIVKNFTIVEEIVDFSVEPGFIAFAEKEFVIEVQNLQDNQIEINIKKINGIIAYTESPENAINSLRLSAGRKKNIYFMVSDAGEESFFNSIFGGEGGANASLQFVELSSENTDYKIPVYISFSEETISKTSGRFKFEPSNINLTVISGSSARRIIYLTNTGERVLNDISITISESISDYTSLSNDFIEELGEGESAKIEINFTSTEGEKTLEGQITAKESSDVQSIFAYAFVALTLTGESYTPVPDSQLTCFEHGGEKCGKGYKCDLPTKSAKDGICCIGTCIEIKEGYTGKIIGFLILIGVIVFLLWFYKYRYKKPRKELAIFRKKKEGENLKKELKQITPQPPRIIPPRPVKKPLVRVPRTIVKYVEKPVKEKVIIVEKPVIKEKKKLPRKKPKKYVGSMFTRRYHKSSCKFSKLIEKKYEISEDDAKFFRLRGYKKCKKCLS